MRDEKFFAVYIVTNTPRGVLYTGVTSALIGRISKHRQGLHPGFTRRWGLKRLVRYESCADAESAIRFERRLKRWRRSWKIALVERMNPTWRDLWPELVGGVGEASGGAFDGPG